LSSGPRGAKVQTLKPMGKAKVQTLKRDPETKGGQDANPKTDGKSKGANPKPEKGIQKPKGAKMQTLKPMGKAKPHIV
jgi:hypothetical protein